MEWREDEDEARTSLYEQDEYRLYIGNPLDDPNYVPNTGAVRAAYATDYYMVQVRGGHNELERAERFDRWLAAHDEQVRADERERIAQAVAPLLNELESTPSTGYYAPWAEATQVAIFKEIRGGAPTMAADDTSREQS